MEKNIQNLKTQYEDAVRTYANNRDEGMAKARQTLAASNATFLKDAQEKFGPAYTLDYLNSVVKQLEHAKTIYDKQKYDAERLEETRRAHLRQEEDRAIGRGLQAESIRDRQERREEKSDAKVTKDTLPMIEAIQGIEHLQDQLQDKEVQKGLLARAQPLLEKLKSLSGNEDFESAVNRELTGTDKTTLFLKDALLETYNIERAAKGGQRLTVQDMKTIGPVLDPTNYTAEAYNALLENRRARLYNSLQLHGMSPEEIGQKTKRLPYTPYGGSAPAAAPSPAASKAMPSEEKVKAYADAYFGGDVSAAKQHLQSEGYK
jgi:hypothetical protein